MTRYLVERLFGAIEDDDLQALARRSRDVGAESFPEIVWEHSHVCADEAGEVRSYCVYVAPDEHTVHEHAAMVGGHEIVKVVEIVGDVSPATLGVRGPAQK